MPRSVCRDPDNQFRFEAEFEQCHATYALVSRQQQVKGDEVVRQAMAWSAHLKPPKT